MEGWSRGRIAGGALIALLLAGAIGLARGGRLPPADLAFCNAAEVTSLDPATCTGIPEGRVLRALFEGLCVKDPATLEPLPGMAESWEVSDDGRTYTFAIRRGSFWTNGDEVSAHDFVFSFRRLLEPETASPWARHLWCVRGARAYAEDRDPSGAPRHTFEDVGIAALGDHELRIELERPVPYFLDLCAYPLLPVNERSLREARERDPDGWQQSWMRPEHLATNGPFRLVFRRVNDRLRLARSDGYWDRAEIGLATIDVLATDHVTTILNLYLTGAVAWCDQVPAALVGDLAGRADFHVAPFLGAYFYRVNVTRPPFDDVRVRRALALAIDREAIARHVTRAGEQPAWSFVPPGIAGYASVEMAHAADSDPAAAFERDVGEARRLLAEAGYGPGGRELAVEIHYNTQANHRAVAEVVADGWRRHLGARVGLANQEWKVFLDAQRTLDYDVSRSSWIADYADPSTFLEVFEQDGENNRTGWGDPRYDALLERARASRGAERTAALREAEALLLEELPILPIYAYVTKNLVDPRLEGFEPNALDEHFPKFWRWRDGAAAAASR